MIDRLTQKNYPDTLEFTDGIQKRIVALLLADKEGFASNLKKVTPEIFENPALRDMVALVHGFYLKYHRQADQDEFLQEFSNFLDSKKNIPVDEYFGVLEEVMMLVEEGSFDYARDRVTEFARQLSMRHALLESADLLKKKRYEEIADIIVAATGDNAEKERMLDMVNLSTVERQELDWFWKDRIPRGKLTIIVGQAGVGKSWLSLWMAARVTNGESWPDCPGHHAEKGRVLILANEDGVGDTIVPRFQDCGGDVAMVEVIQGTKNTDGTTTLFNLARDLDVMEKAIVEHGDVRLLVIDPIKAYLGVGKGIDSNNDQDVRAVLAPLCMLAEKQSVTVIGLMHFNKKMDLSALDRISGSTAWGATARSVWMVSWDPDNELGMPKRRVFAPVKNNLSAINSSIIFTIEDGGVVIQSSDGILDATEILQGGDRSRRERKLEKAKKLLLDALEVEPVESWVLFELAKEEGISEKTLRTAKEELGIEAVRTGGKDGKWFWHLTPEAAVEETVIEGSKEPLEEPEPKPVEQPQSQLLSLLLRL